MYGEAHKGNPNFLKYKAELEEFYTVTESNGKYTVKRKEETTAPASAVAEKPKIVLDPETGIGVTPAVEGDLTAQPVAEPPPSVSNRETSPSVANIPTEDSSNEGTSLRKLSYHVTNLPAFMLNCANEDIINSTAKKYGADSSIFKSLKATMEKYYTVKEVNEKYRKYSVIEKEAAFNAPLSELEFFRYYLNSEGTSVSKERVSATTLQKTSNYFPYGGGRAEQTNTRIEDYSDDNAPIVDDDVPIVPPGT
jgi:hypothetical protein